jgi:GntR family transcriptional repressor for pyruvate dehydrogenase complex
MQTLAVKSDPPESLKPVRRVRLYEQVIERLLAYVHDGRLQAGERLPTERQLARQLGVSRVSVREAIVALQVHGVVEVRHGGGIFLRPESALQRPITDLLQKRHRLPEILEVRETLECKLAELAALRRTDGDLHAIDEAIAAMEVAIGRGLLPDDADAAFHRAVTSAGRNSLLAQLMESLSDAIRETRLESLAQPGRPFRSLAGHRRISEAIRQGDPRAAATAMRRHLRVVSNLWLLRWQPVPAGHAEEGSQVSAER